MRNTTEISDRDIRANRLGFAMIDQLSANRDFVRGRAFVVNTAASTDPAGIHWIAMRRFRDGVLIFDPLGKGNERPHDDVMITQLAPMGAIHWFPYAVQSTKTHHCGWFAISAAKIMQRAEDNESAIEEIKQAFVPVQKTAPNGRAAKENVRFLIRLAGYESSGSEEE